MGFFEIFAAALAGLYGFVQSYGIAIILLTVAVRILVLPLSIKQTRSMREMQRIQPELKKIQQKHKGDRQKMNEEMMALYKEHSVNPFGGCLPLVLQFPVLIALFYVVRSPLNYLKGTLDDSALASALKEVPLQVHQFLGLRLDCSAGQFVGTSDPQSAASEALQCGTGDFALLAFPYLVLVGLMGLTTWYQQKQMQVKSTGGAKDMQAQQMQMMGRIMPVMLMVFAFSFPSGVVVYWLTTNLWTIGQQRLMLRVAPPVDHSKTAAASTTQPALGNGDPPAPSKPNPSASKKKRKKR